MKKSIKIDLDRLQGARVDVDRCVACQGKKSYFVNVDKTVLAPQKS